MDPVKCEGLWGSDPAGVVQRPKTPESRKYEEITKDMQNPPPRVGPRKYENKRNTKMAIKHHFYMFLFFSGGGQPGVGDFVFLFLFRISGILAFLASVPPPQDRNFRAHPDLKT